MSKAYISLKKYKQCIELLTNKEDPDLKIVLKEAIQLKEKEEKASKKVEEKQVMATTKIQKYFLDRKWKLAKRNQQLPEGVEIQFVDDKISIPIIIIYPEFGQFDLIAKSNENQKISECLG